MEFIRNLAENLNLTLKEFFLVIGFILILITIPLVSLMLKNSQVFSSRASEIKPTAKTNQSITKDAKEIPSVSPLSELQKLLEPTVTPDPQLPTSNELSPTPTTSLAFGPTLNIKVNIEGRAEGKQAAKVFIGIATGRPTSKPTYILSFTADFPDSGEFTDLGLAGLTPGSSYTAYVKGPGQIDSSSTFTMSPTVTYLNNNQVLSLTSGDLNEDNTINNADYIIAKNLYGVTKASTLWNGNADFNNDGIINIFDLGIISKNTGKTGASGVWFSPIPTASSSASLTIPQSIGGYQESTSGSYLIHLP